MNKDKFHSYLVKLHREALFFLTEQLEIPLNFQLAELKCKWGNDTSLEVLEGGNYRISYYASEVSEKTIAQRELEIARETARIAHIQSNPAIHDSLLKEQEFLKRLMPGVKTSLFERLFTLEETVAEFLALQFINQRQFLDVFVARLNPREKYSELYTNILRTFQETDEEKRVDIARRLIRSNYQEARKIPELESRVFSFQETQISENPNICEPPYQLVFTELRHLLG